MPKKKTKRTVISPEEERLLDELVSILVEGFLKQVISEGHPDSDMYRIQLEHIRRKRYFRGQFN